MRKIFLILAVILAAYPAMSRSRHVPAFHSPERPGPSAALFAAPPYQCVTNKYVATTGNDGNSGNLGSPWLTIQHADATAVAGQCINVSPGTYAAGTTITKGGNAATSTGYVVYRCTTLLGCVITDNGKAFNIVGVGSGPNYVMIDGFELAASSSITYGIGINVWSTGDAVFAVHHIWALNNKIHGYGQSGVQMNDGDWYFVLHNETYNNSNVTCDAQGSGISLVALKALSGYTPTAMDLQYTPYHVAVDWNKSYNNILTACGDSGNPSNTDGNGIIMDTFTNTGTTGVLYPYQSLVSFNVTYSNGAKGIWVFRSSFITMANNTSYNNELDPFDNATGRPEIGVGGGHDCVIINNIAWPVPGSTSPTNQNAAFGGFDAAGETNANNTWSNNISFGGTPPFGWGPSGNVMLVADLVSFTCGANKCNVSPVLTNAPGGNFALGGASPALSYGLLESYLPGTSVDAGACTRALTTCP